IGRICRDAEISPTVIFAGSDAAKAGMALADIATGSATKPLDPDDIDRSSFIIYTSGTTGRAKGVLLSLRGMLGTDLRADGKGYRPVAAAPVPLLRSQPFGAQRTRRRRKRAHHGKVLAAAGARSPADREIFGPARRADDVPLSPASRPGDRHRTARFGSPLHLRRRHHARDVEHGIRGALQDAAPR